MISLYNIDKSYGEQKVFENFNIEFNEGELCMLLGPSGCGKSTLLKLINRLIDVDKGKILIQGESVNNYKPELLRRKIGYAIQGVGLFPHMSVYENIAVVMKLLKWDKERIQSRVTELMELMGIPQSYGDKMPNMLSGGEAQRIGVARALGADPDILLMDEPFGALDPITRSRIQDEFVELQRKLHKTVIFVTHDIGEAVKMADRLVLLENGKILADGHPKALIHVQNRNSRTFFGDTMIFELLEKYHLNTLPIKELEIIDKCKVKLDINNTYKDAMARMLESGADYIGLYLNGKLYKVTFNHLLKFFGGGSSDDFSL